MVSAACRCNRVDCCNDGTVNTICPSSYDVASMTLWRTSAILNTFEDFKSITVFSREVNKQMMENGNGILADGRKWENWQINSKIQKIIKSMLKSESV